MMCDCKVTDDLKHTTYTILKNIKQDVNEDSCHGAFLFIVDCFKQIVLKFSGVSINNRCIFCLNDEETFRKKRVAVLQKYVPKKRSYSIYTFKQANEANHCIRDQKPTRNLKNSASNKCNIVVSGATKDSVNIGPKIGNQTSGVSASVKDKKSVVDESNRNCVLPKRNRVATIRKKLLEAKTDVVNQLKSVKDKRVFEEESKRNCALRVVESTGRKLLEADTNQLKPVFGEESKRNCALRVVEPTGRKLLEADTNQLKPVFGEEFKRNCALRVIESTDKKLLEADTNHLKPKNINKTREIFSKKEKGQTDSRELPKTKCNVSRDKLLGRAVGGKKLQADAKTGIKVSKTAVLPKNLSTQKDPKTPSRRRRSKSLSYNIRTPTQLQRNQTLKRVRIPSQKAGALRKAASKGLQNPAQKTKRFYSDCKLEYSVSFSKNVQIFEKSEEEVSKPFDRMHGVLNVIKADVQGTLNNLAQLQANYNSKDYNLDFLLD